MLRTYQPKKRHRAKGAWFPSENGHQKRPEGSLSPPCKRPQSLVRLILCARECGITPSKLLMRGEWKSLLFAPSVHPAFLMMFENPAFLW